MPSLELTTEGFRPDPIEGLRHCRGLGAGVCHNLHNHDKLNIPNAMRAWMKQMIHYW